jgi:ferrochelatase
MAFRSEPAFTHGQAPAVGLLYVNLGTPDAPTAPALRRYLAEFLSDPRVVEIPRLLWALILYGVILRVRPAKSAAKYASVWMEGGSPLLVWTRRQASGLQALLDQSGHRVLVRAAMRYGNPSIASALDELRSAGANRVLVLPAYPQYSGATTASAFDGVAAWAVQSRRLPEFRFINEYHDDPPHIAALATSVQAHWAANGRSPMLVMSFHGMPQRTLELGDPYHCQCHKTARLLAEALGLRPADYRVTFQSRFGRAKWLEPSTEPTLRQLATKGLREVDVICPGFSADCLETLEEIALEGREAFIASGGQTLRYIPCLNDSPAGLKALHGLALRHLSGWPIQPDDPALEPSALAASQQRAGRLGAPR